MHVQGNKPNLKTAYCVIPFIWNPRTGESNQQVAAFGGKQLDGKSMREFSEIMEMFCIWHGYELPRCMPFSKLPDFYT